MAATAGVAAVLAVRPLQPEVSEARDTAEVDQVVQTLLIAAAVVVAWDQSAQQETVVQV